MSIKQSNIIQLQSWLIEFALEVASFRFDAGASPALIPKNFQNLDQRELQHRAHLTIDHLHSHVHKSMSVSVSKSQE